MHHQLTVCTKLVFTGGQQAVGLFLRHIGCPGDQQAVGTDIVIAAIVFIQAFLVDTNAIFIEGQIGAVISIRHRAIVHHQLAVCAELVFAGGQQAIGLFRGHIGCPGDQQAVGADIVIAAIVFVQAFLVDADAIFVEVQIGAVISISHRAIVHHQLAVCAELVFAGGQQAVGLFLRHIGCPGDQQAIGADIVIAAIVFVQAFLVDADAIFVEVQIGAVISISHRAIVHHQLAISTKLVFTSRHQTIGLFLRHINAPGCQQAVGADIVIVAIVFIQAFLVDTNAILVEVQIGAVIGVCHRAVVHHQLAICAELVFAGRQQAVGLFLGNVGTPGNEQVIASGEIVIVFKLHQLVANHHAIFSEIHVPGLRIHKRARNGRNQSAVIRKFITAQILAASGNSALANQGIAVVVEVVHFAVNFQPLVLVVPQRIVVSSPLNTINDKGIPRAQDFALLAFHLVHAVSRQSEGTNGCISGSIIEVVGITVNGNKATLLEVCLEIHPSVSIMVEAGIGEIRQINTVVVEGAHCAINQALTGHLYAVDKVIGIVVPAVRNQNAVHIGLSVAVLAVEQVFTCAAGQLAFCINLPVMVLGRNGLTPVNHRITDIAEGSVRITAAKAGSRNILHRHGGVDMAGASFRQEGRIHELLGNVPFRVHAELFVGEGAGGAIGKGNHTHVHIHLHILRPELIIARPISLCRIAGCPNVRIEVNHTNGKRSQRCFTHLLVLPCPADCDVCRIGFGVHRVFSGKPVCHHHVVQFPMVYIVQVDGGGNGLNGFNVGGIDIHPVNRTAVQSVQRRIGGHHLHRGHIRAGIHRNHANNAGLIAHIVADFELNAMHSICHSDAGNAHDAVIEGNLHFLAIHIGLGGIDVQTGGIGFSGILRNLCEQAQNIVAGGDKCMAFQLRGGVIFSHQVHGAKDGCFPVIGSLGVVGGNVVHIQRIRTVDGAILLNQRAAVGVRQVQLNKAVESHRVRVTGNRIAQKAVAVFTRNQNAAVGTDVHREIVPTAFVKHFVSAVQNSGSVLGIIDTVPFRIIIIVNLQLQMDHILRDIQPEAEGLGIPNHHRLVGIQFALRPTCCGNSCARNRVEMDSHGAFSVMHLAVSSSGMAQLLNKAFVVAIHIANVPATDISSVFKIKDNFGRLAQIQCSRGDQLRIAAQRCRQHTGHIRRRIFGAYRFKGETVKGAQGFVCSCERNIICT